MRKSIKYLLEFVAGLATLLVLLFGLLVWQLSNAPMHWTFLTGALQRGLSQLIPHTEIQLVSSLLVWDNTDRSIAIEGESVMVYDQQQKLIATLPIVKLKLSLLGLLQGRLIPAALDIERPQLWLSRHFDGSLSFGSVSTANAKSNDNADRDMKNMAHQIAGELTNNSLLHELKLKQVIINIHDERSERDWALSLSEAELFHDRNAVLGLGKIEVVQRDHVSLIMAHYNYNLKTQQHELKLRFAGINPAFLAGQQAKGNFLAVADLPLTGEIQFGLNSELNLANASYQIDGSAGTILLPDFWDDGLPVKAISLKGVFDSAAANNAILNADIDLDYTRLQAAIDLAVAPVGTNYDQNYSVNLKLANLPMSAFGKIWPKAVTPNARIWLTENFSKGQFANGEVTLQGRLNRNNLADTTLDGGQGKISALNMSVRYIESMPPVENVNAQAKFDLKHMDIAINSGNIKSIKILPSQTVISDFDKDTQNILLPLKINGSVRDVVELLDSPPLGYAKAVGLKAKATDGKLDGLLEMRFPLLKTLALKDMVIKADARLQDFSAKDLIPDINLTQGNFALNLTLNGFSLRGGLALNTVPAQVSYQNWFNVKPGQPHSSADITAVVRGEQWKSFGVDFLGKMVGATSASIHYQQISNDLNRLSGELDLRQTAIHLDELNWIKPMGEAAQLSFSADIPNGKNININSLDLVGKTIHAKGSALISGENSELLALDLQPLQVGRTNANLHFTQSSKADGQLSFTAEGEAFDVSGLRGGKEPAPSDPRPKDYNLRLNKLYTSDNGYIENASVHARRDKAGWVEIELHGMADGGHQLDVSLAKILGDANGRRSLNVTCDDFGKVLKGMGFTDTVRDGSLRITGVSAVDDPRAIDGEVKIGSFVVSDLPVLGRLLNAASPFGFADFVTGNSSFDHLIGKFRWHGDVIDLHDMRAAGSVFGVNVEGRVDLNNGMANLNGTLVPFSFVNRVINAIPLIGSLITGGDGQGVIAASYTVKGSLGEPVISVNPVSLLTPGFIRNIFFNGDEEEKP